MATFHLEYSLEMQILLVCLSSAPDSARLTVLLGEKPDWKFLYNQGLRHGLLPLLYQATKKYPDPLVPRSVSTHLQSWFASHALRCLQMQKELRRVVRLLTDAKISVIPFKGPILAEEVYGDVALRSFVDLDLLVPPDQALAATQVLLSQGYKSDFNLPLKRWAGLQKTDNHLPLHHPLQRWSVEIHWEMSHPMYSLPFDLSRHWAGLAGGREGRLDIEEILVMLCIHGTKHCWAELKWLVDIDRLLRCGRPVNWEKALFWGEYACSLRSLLLGLNLTRTLCETPLNQELAARIGRDEAVQSLTNDWFANFLNKDPERKHSYHEYAFYMKSRDNTGDSLRQLFRWLFWPRRADWEAFPLAGCCYWLYYIERPVRMVWKWAIRSVLRRGSELLLGTTKTDD